VRFDRRVLLRAARALDLLLAGNRVIDAIEDLRADKCVEILALGEAFGLA